MEELNPSAEAVTDNSHLKDPESGSVPARFPDFLKRKLEHVTSPKSSVNIPSSHKSPMKAPATPLTTVITGLQWLRTIIFPLPPKPSPELEQYLSSCDRDVSTGITRRANIILEAIFTSNNLQSASMMDPMWAAHRKLESLKLYYKVLQGMCVAEAQILKLSNLTSLLTNERFHRCMLACSSDLVLVAHKTTTVLFSEIIDKIGITAFDLSKVIESFIRHEETLPRELRRHLNSLEEQLLESLVWGKGSSLYNSLAVARPALSSEISRLGFLAEPMSSLDEISINTDVSCGSYPCTPSVLKVESSSGHPADMQSPKRSRTGYRSGLVERSPFKTPVKDRILSLNKVTPKPLTPALQSIFASPARPNPGDGGETCAEIVINVFFHKIVKLAAVRIKGMVERLEVSQQTRETVYRLFQQILSEKTSLFFNRHVDQIILCCFYAVAKISQLKLSFSEIVSHYKRQSHYKPQVLQSVFVECLSAERTLRYGNVNLGIMEFYNKIFIPCTKQLLKELKPVGSPQCTDPISETNKNSNGNCPESPKLSPFPKLPDMSPRKISSTHNVYVSPLRARKIDALISNGSKSYYACIGESTHAFRSPSKDLSAINNRLNGNRKLRGMLNFDDVVDGGFGFVSDSIVAKTLSLQNESRTPSSPVPTVQSEKVDS